LPETKVSPPLQAPAALQVEARRPTQGRTRFNAAFAAICVAATVCCLLLLVALLVSVFQQGWLAVTWDFIRLAPHTDPSRAGIWPVILGSAAVCFVCAL